MKRNQILFPLVLILLLTACQTGKPSPTITPTPEAQSAYPQPTFVEEVYPGPEGNQPSIESKVTPGVVPEPPQDAPQPEAGKGSISGVLYSISKNSALAFNTFFLTAAEGDNKKTPPPFTIGPVEGRGNILGSTDENGEFSLANVPPGNYFFIAWAPMDWPMAVTSPEDQTYRLVEISADQKNILGIVYIP